MAKDFAYPVPAVMRYPRPLLPDGAQGSTARAMDDETGGEETEDAAEAA